MMVPVDEAHALGQLARQRPDVELVGRGRTTVGDDPHPYSTRSSCRRTHRGVPQLRPFCRGLAAAALALLLLAGGAPNAAMATMKPSIVLILTDDQEVGLLEPMPNLRSLIIDRGATFRR